MTEKDDFWNLERILPRKKIHVHNKNENVECIDVSTSTPNDAKVSGVDIRMLISAVNEKCGVNSLENAIVKESEYPHFRNSNVITSAFVGKYNNTMVYENKIRSHAISLYHNAGQDDVPFVEYFSFTPAFYELSSEQLNYYLSWRRRAREGIFQKTSASYVFLYVTEIVNLPDKISPEDGLITLIVLWDECLSNEKRYDKAMADVIFDYAVIHGLKIPFILLEPIFLKTLTPFSSILSSLFVYDYLLVSKKELGENELKFLYEKELGFSFRTGKHYRSNPFFKDLLDTYFYSVLQVFFKNSPAYISEIFSKHEKRSSPIKVVRPAFLSINTSVEIKKNLLYDYYVYDKNDVELDHLINLAKHIENRFRALSSIRARLSVSPLPDESKRLIDTIISKLLPSVSNGEPIRQTLHEAKKVTLDVNRAKFIEEESWQTTKKLTDGIEIFYDDEDVEECEHEEVSELSGFELLFSQLDLHEKKILSLLAEKNINKAETSCRENGTFLDSEISRINELSSDSVGDVIIDISTKEIFDEYVDEVTMLLSKEKE